MMLTDVDNFLNIFEMAQGLAAARARAREKRESALAKR